MSHRHFFVVLLALTTLGCAAQRPVDEAFEGEPLGKIPTRPNIIYILADDLGYGDLAKDEILRVYQAFTAMADTRKGVMDEDTHHLSFDRQRANL